MSLLAFLGLFPLMLLLAFLGLFALLLRKGGRAGGEPGEEQHQTGDSNHVKRQHEPAIVSNLQLVVSHC